MTDKKQEDEHVPLDIPFDVTYTISFSGRTKSDGKYTVTTAMIRDKLQAVLEEMLFRGFIRDFSVSMASNNIEQAEETLKKSKRDGEK